jgi:hypothetical protein
MKKDRRGRRKNKKWRRKEDAGNEGRNRGRLRDTGNREWEHEEGEGKWGKKKTEERVGRGMEKKGERRESEPRRRGGENNFAMRTGVM